MKIVIKIDTANDAFQGNYLGVELHRVFDSAISKIALAIASPSDLVELPLQDSNGNTIGTIEVAKP